jgi:3-hydroxybutyryl-CoA dehydrogenase
MNEQTTIRRIAVIGGGGLMGHGIVLACINADPDVAVTLVSHRQDSADHGMALCADGPYGLGTLVKKGKISQDEAKLRLARVRPTTNLAEAVAQADLVFESIPENVADKCRALRDIDTAARPDAIIASGTSAIMIAELAGAIGRPERLVGTHWFAPSNVMPLVEVVRSEQTDPRVVETTLAYLRKIRKKPVVVRDSPGFFTTRFINLFLAEAIRVVDEGICGIEDVDEMVKTGLGWPMGVFELLDKTATFDSFYHVQEYLQETLGERWAVPPLARRVMSSGYRGVATLKPGSRGGWYDYYRKEMK